MNSLFKVFNNFRIIEKQDIKGNVIFIPQERKYLFFWAPFMEMTMFPKRIEFDNIESAIKFLNRQVQRPKEKIHYY